jgi:hypothetical protein
MRSKASRISQSFVSEVGYTLGCSVFRTITAIARVTATSPTLASRRSGVFAWGLARGGLGGCRP